MKQRLIVAPIACAIMVYLAGAFIYLDAGWLFEGGEQVRGLAFFIWISITAYSIAYPGNYK